MRLQALHHYQGIQTDGLKFKTLKRTSADVTHSHVTVIVKIKIAIGILNTGSGRPKPL